MRCARSKIARISPPVVLVDAPGCERRMSATLENQLPPTFDPRTRVTFIAFSRLFPSLPLSHVYFNTFSMDAVRLFRRCHDFLRLLGAQRGSHERKGGSTLPAERKARDSFKIIKLISVALLNNEIGQKFYKCKLKSEKEVVRTDLFSSLTKLEFLIKILMLAIKRSACIAHKYSIRIHVSNEYLLISL